MIHKNNMGCVDAANGYDKSAKGNFQACIQSNIWKGHRYVQITDDGECWGSRNCIALEEKIGSTIYDVKTCMGKGKLKEPYLSDRSEQIKTHILEIL